MIIIDKYNQRVEKANSLLCVGLDPDFEKLPAQFKEKEFSQFEFNKYIIDQTAEFAATFKPNPAFYESRGDAGVRELKMTVDYIRENYPDIFIICDSKRADIGNTNNGYAVSVFDWLGADAITLHPYLGKEALKPFLDRTDKASIILCRTSNPGAGELQDLEVNGQPFWEVVTQKVVNEWNGNNNCMACVGGTYPEEMKKAREIAPQMVFLVPGIGAQGGEIEPIVKAGLDANKRGLIINSSRGIIFAENPREEAKKLRDEINKYR